MRRVMVGLVVVVCLWVVGVGGVAAATTRPSGGEGVCGVDALAGMVLTGGGKEGAALERADGVARVALGQKPQNVWDVQVGVKNQAAVQKDDVLFVRFEMRTVATNAESGEGLVTVVFEENTPPHGKSIETSFSAGKEWAEFVMAGKAKRDYAAGEGRFAVFAGAAQQTLEIRNLEVLNYGKKHDLRAFPYMKATYAGREKDAPWRKAAAERIEKLRKGDLTIEIVDGAGKPVAGVEVKVKMTRHAFGFGSAVTAAGIMGTTPDDEKYRAFIEENFSRVVFENDLKWPQWEREGTRQRTLDAIAWLEARKIEVRGHTLVWPSWRYSPKGLEALKDDPEALRKRVRERVTSAVAAVKGRIVEWDVINEVYANHQVVDILGKAEMVEWFKLARAADEKPRLYINDYGILSGQGMDRKHQDAYFEVIKYLKDAGAPIGGIGMQSHFGGTPTPPERMLKILDRFAATGLTIASTEFDIRTRDEELQADFTRDFLTTMFSHEAVNGVVMWGFWEGRHWIPDAAMFRKDWTAKPNAKAWLDLVKKEWWTEATVRTDAAGVAKVRGFCGSYEVSAAGMSATATLPREGRTLKFRTEPTRW